MNAPAKTTTSQADDKPGTLAVPEQAGDLIKRIGHVEAEWDDLDDLDLVEGHSSGVPFIRTDGNLDGGLFIDDEKVDEVRCVIAARANSRSKFEKTWDEDKNARPICWSSNGIVPDDTVPERQSDTCATCPVSFERMPENQRKLACKKNLELLAYVPDDSDIAIMRLRLGGISVKHAMHYWASFATRIPKKHPIGFVTRITMVPEDTPNGKKLAAHFERVNELSREQAEIFVTDARRRKTMWQQMVAADVNDVTAQAGDGGDHGPFDDASHVDPETGEILRPGPTTQKYQDESVF